MILLLAGTAVSVHFGRRLLRDLVHAGGHELRVDIQYLLPHDFGVGNFQVLGFQALLQGTDGVPSRTHGGPLTQAVI
jgi:hypothetical protein